MEFTFPYETRVEEIQFAGNHLAIECLNNLDDTIDTYFEEYARSGREELFEDLCPYFGVPWPAGRALAEYCAKNSKLISGREVLEIGCGLALPSLVLAKMGASVLATDVHPDVPVFLDRNCARNDIRNLGFESLDWRIWRDRKFSFVLASDILYDRTQSASLLKFLDESLEVDGEAWITDPGRSYWEGFGDSARERGYSTEDSKLGEIFFRRLKKRK